MHLIFALLTSALVPASRWAHGKGVHPIFVKRLSSPFPLTMHRDWQLAQVLLWTNGWQLLAIIGFIQNWDAPP